MAEKLINLRERKRQLIAESKQGRKLLHKEWAQVRAPAPIPMAGTDALLVMKPVWVWVVPLMVGFQVAAALKRKTKVTVRKKSPRRHHFLAAALALVSDRFVPHPLARAVLKALPFCWRTLGLFRRI
jgi:hypothetical protein